MPQVLARTAATLGCYRSAQLCGSQGGQDIQQPWGGRVSQHPARDKTGRRCRTLFVASAGNSGSDLDAKDATPHYLRLRQLQHHLGGRHGQRTPQTSRTTAPPRWTSRLRAWHPEHPARQHLRQPLRHLDGDTACRGCCTSRARIPADDAVHGPDPEVLRRQIWPSGKTASGGRLNLPSPYRGKARRRHDSADGGRHIAH